MAELGHVVFYVRNLEESVRFYADVRISRSSAACSAAARRC